MTTVEIIRVLSSLHPQTPVNATRTTKNKTKKRGAQKIWYCEKRDSPPAPSSYLERGESFM